MEKIIYYSPLRYPGGKRNFVPLFTNVFHKSELNIRSYYELYAGGAAAALELLLKGLVKKIYLNDADYHIYAFWFSILNHTEEFIKKVQDTEVTISEWQNQKLIYQNTSNEDITAIGFSTFFLNRTNRSGILTKAGPIGGINQNGNYKLDVRFNKPNLINLITKIALRKDDITLYNEDAIVLMKKLGTKLKGKRTFLFLDPPYFEKGKDLYFNFYQLENHLQLKRYLEKHMLWNWILSYDNCSAIAKLYQKFPKRIFEIKYSLQEKKNSKEIVIFSNALIDSKNRRDIFIR